MLDWSQRTTRTPLAPMTMAIREVSYLGCLPSTTEAHLTASSCPKRTLLASTRNAQVVLSLRPRGMAYASSRSGLCRFYPPSYFSSNVVYDSSLRHHRSAPSRRRRFTSIFSGREGQAGRRVFLISIYFSQEQSAVGFRIGRGRITQTSKGA